MSNNENEYPKELFDLLRTFVLSSINQIDKKNISRVKIKNKARQSNWQIKKQINRELRKYEKSKIKN